MENDSCLIYDVRPYQCRMFPFWPENLQDVESWQAVKEICQGIGRGRFHSVDAIGEMLARQSKSDKSDSYRQCMKKGGTNKIKLNIKKAISKGKIQRAHFSQGISARANTPIVTAEVGIIKLLNPSPN